MVEGRTLCSAPNQSRNSVSPLGGELLDRVGRGRFGAARMETCPGVGSRPSPGSPDPQSPGSAWPGSMEGNCLDPSGRGGPRCYERWFLCQTTLGWLAP